MARDALFTAELVRVPATTTDAPEAGSTLQELAGQTLQDLSGTPLSEL